MDSQANCTELVKYQTIQWLRHRSPTPSNAWMMRTVPDRTTNGHPSASSVGRRPLPLSTSAKTADNLRLSVSALTPLPPRRSKSVPPDGSQGLLSEEVELKARSAAEKAMKSKKVFTIVGPYPTLRNALRRRGWVEKFPSKSHRKDRAKKDGKDDMIENAFSSEEDVVFSVMSQVVRNCTPALVFTVKAVDVGTHATRNSQIVNHFGRSSSFTTKAGLSQNLRNVSWYTGADPDSFYPRCYNLSDPDDKELFLDDYRLTSCCGFIKHFLLGFGIDVSGGRQPSGQRKCDAQSRMSYSAGMTTRMALEEVMKANEEFDMKLEDDDLSTSAIIASLQTEDKCGNDQRSVATDESPGLPSADDYCGHQLTCFDRSKTNDNSSDSGDTVLQSSLNNHDPSHEKFDPSNRIPLKALRFAIQHCRNYLKSKDNEDIDTLQEKYEVPESDWIKFFAWHYAFIKDEEQLENANAVLVSLCKELLFNLRRKCPQLDLDGCRNIWIIKPGAKSRGRGIQCRDKYEDIRRLVEEKDHSIVIQKYIERPLLIHKTKFDIRQWFLVTDWNPLTFWFYSDSYLRFCSQEFSLDDLHISAHLSNNSVQKHFTPSATRSKQLPEDNMWTSDEFQDYLRRSGYGRIWMDEIVPGMKQAILCALLCTQEHVECRKSAFELYGADFMLTEDLQPWLIEINSSPSMARSTPVTMQLVDHVFEDTLKVILDRKNDKNCDTGRFELVYKQTPISEPPNSSINLSVQGKRIRKKSFKRR